MISKVRSLVALTLVGLLLVACGKSPYEQALSLAEEGDPSAQWTLGEMYLSGEDQEVTQDYAEAMKWYQLAAEQEYPSAEHSIGQMYEEGLGVERDHAEAMAWYQDAAERGHAPAQAKVGEFYRYGEGTEQDFAEAMRWSKLAAEQGNAVGQETLGYMYRWGEGVDQDFVEALKWLQLAAEQSDDGYAMNTIGRIYEKGGNGIDQDYANAMEWYELGAEQSNSWALNNLGRMHHWGYGVDENYTMAKLYYERAVALGDSDARSNLEELEARQSKRVRDRYVKNQLGDQRSISHNICSTWERVMLNQTVPFREQGYPVSNAESTYNSEDDVGTRVFLKRFVRSVYEDPAEGKEMIENGRFFVMCVQEHRGF